MIDIIIQGWPQSCESREISGETETMKMDPRRDQSRGLESRLQALTTMQEAKVVLRQVNRWIEVRPKPLFSVKEKKRDEIATVPLG